MAILGGVLSYAYWLLCMPVAALMALILPILSISNAKDVILNGYSFPGNSNGNLDVAWALCVILYVSLRFKGLRRFYAVFPWAYQTLKMFTISGLFTSGAMTAVNLAFKQTSAARRTTGVVLFFAIIAVWRVFMSVYYTKKPLVPFIEERRERLKRVQEVS